MEERAWIPILHASSIPTPSAAMTPPLVAPGDVRVPESPEPLAPRREFGAALVVGYCSAVGYGVALAYETAYCSEFGIPHMFVRIGLENVVAGVALFFVSILAAVGLRYLIVRPWSARIATPSAVPVTLLLLLPLLAPLVLFPRAYDRQLRTLVPALIGIALVSLPLDVRRGGPRAFLRAYWSRLSHPVSLVDVFALSGRTTVLWAGGFAAFALLGANNVGHAEAASAREFLVTTGSEPVAVIRSYSDYAICLRVTDLARSTEATKVVHGLTILPLSSFANRPLEMQVVER